MKFTRQQVIIGTTVIAAASLYFFNAYHHLMEGVQIIPVNAWWMTPFVLLLGSIAVAPFINRHWWEHNYPYVAYLLGAIVVVYYIFALGNVPRLLLTAHEYISFISLIGSLYVVAGGINIRIKGTSAPHENILLLAVGAVISNFLGTTGASMLLIRPYLRVNKHRIRPYHVVFFIFIVSNIGGALTPIGDPPLFLGYLKGIPFFWVIGRVWEAWALAVIALLAVFYFIDRHYFKLESEKQQAADLKPEKAQASGLHNIFFLGMILVSVFIESPIMLREVIMWAAALGSYYTTKKEVHEKNDFNFIPIQEVAILFVGIFATMIPALDWLELNSQQLGIVTTGQYFWGTGVLSSFLDNAPTYLNFLSAAFGLHGASVDNFAHMQVMLDISTPEALGLTNPLQTGAMAISAETWKYIQAISLGAVFFGANTYIGNGPNFMVKSIAEQAKVEMPSFFGYVVKYTIPILIPIFAVVWYLFFAS